MTNRPEVLPIPGEPRWIARAKARGIDDALRVLAELVALAPDGSQAVRAATSRDIGRGQRFDVRVIFERIRRPGDPPWPERGNSADDD